MILRLDPRLPLVWRSPSSVQLGVDPPVVVLEEVTEIQERILAALAVGVSEPGVTMIAQGHLDQRDDLLGRLAPALGVATALGAGGAAGSAAGGASGRAEPASAPTVAISGDGSAVSAIADALAASGARVLMATHAADLADSAPDVAIVTAHHVLAPALHALWLRRDVPHLPVVFSDIAVLIGPMVEPGVGPCLLCLELHRRDADPAWPAIATQLLGRSSRLVAPALMLEAAAAACRATLGRLAAGADTAFTSTRIDGDTGQRREFEVQPHPECGCRGIQRLLERETAGRAPRPGRPGIDWAAGGRRAPAGTARTRSARAGAAPA